MSQFMKSETRPAPDAVLLVRVQEICTTSHFVCFGVLGRDPRAAIDMHQHDKLIHLGVKTTILVMIFMFLPEFGGWFGIVAYGFGEVQCALKLVLKPSQHA